MALGAGLSMFVATVGAWTEGETKIDMMSGTQTGLRRVTADLREAMSVTFNTEKTAVTYVLPKKDGTGQYTMPLVSDGVTRKFYIEDGKLKHLVGAQTRTISSGILTTDPEHDDAAIAVFNPGAGVIPHQVYISLLGKSKGNNGEQLLKWAKEVVQLRNVPKVTQ
jgi:hypothetical protein